jgi:hypothetical protein
MKKIFKSILLIAAVATGMTTFTGCSDDDLSGPDGLFRPIISEDNIEHGLTADKIPYMIIKWDNYNTANKYVVTISANDGSDTRTIETSELKCRFDNLGYDREYNIDINSANTTNGLTSKVFSLTTTSLDYPTALKSMQTTDLIDVAARLKWDFSDDVVYDRIEVIKDETDEIVDEIIFEKDEAGNYTEKAQEMIDAKETIIRGLEPKTAYRAVAYLGDEYKGKVRFSTVASESYEGEVVDLRGLDESESYKWFKRSVTDYTNSIDSVIQAHPDADITFVLEGGTLYKLETLAIPATTGKLTFVTGLTLAGNAEFDVTGNFTVVAGEKVGGFHFERLNFYGPMPDEGDNNYGGKYLFNIGNSGAAIGSVTLKDCNIKWKRGVIRIQTSASIENVDIDGCFCDSIGGYGIVNADNANAEINNIKVSNSTFSTCQVLFTGTKGKDPKEVSVNHCTFWRCSADKKYVVDYKGRKVSKFEVKDCLFGPTFGATGLEFYTGDAVPNVDGLCFTSDVLWRINSEEDPTPKAQVDGTTLSTDAAGTFKDAANDDFTVISGDLGGASKPTPGDPRWY